MFGCPVEKSATCEFASAFSSKSSQGFYFPRDDDYRYDGQLMGFSIHSSDDSVCVRNIPSIDVYYTLTASII